MIYGKPSLANNVSCGGNRWPTGPNNIITKIVTEMLGPVFAAVYDATQAISSNIQCLTVSALAASWNFSSEETLQTLFGQKILQAYSATIVPQTHSAHVASEEESK